MANGNEKWNDGYDYGPVDSEEFSLESILAEYKGSAFISGDKKTPKDVLEAQAERIILEATGKLPKMNANKPDKEPEPPAEEDFFADLDRIFEEKEAKEAEKTPPVFSEKATKQNKLKSDAIFEPEMKTEPEPEPEPAPAVHTPLKEAPENPDKGKIIDIRDLTDDDVRFFENFAYAAPDAVPEHAQEVQEAVEKGEELFEEERKPLFGWLARWRDRRQSEEEDEPSDDFENEEFFEEDEEEYEPEPEPDLLEEAKRFAAGRRSLAIRTFFAFGLCVVMAVFTFLFEGGKSLPFGIGENAVLLTGILVLLQLVVMLLGVDTLIDGVSDLIKLEPGAETIVALSCIMSAISAMVMIYTGDVHNGLPFSVVSAFSLAFAMHGRKMYRLAMKDSLRMAVAVSSPYGVISDYGNLEERAILKKIPSTTEGFYRNLTTVDIAETAYSFATPLLIVASLVFALLASIGKGRPEDFAYSFTALIAVSASFSALSTYNIPFKLTADKGKKLGCAIAGWGGACTISDSDGTLITDEDIFPVGTVSINGIKLFEGVSTPKAFVYTSSLIIASDSGLSRPFSELLKSQGLALAKVDDFACYDGGIGGVIRGERILVGSSGFMNLMGIRVPNGVNVKNAVFTAVNDELIAVFSMNYVPANSVQGALVSLLKTGISMVLAVRDFNMTPLMLQQKFKVSMDGIEYVPAEDCYRISEEKQPKNCDVAAVLCREGLGPFAEAVSRGRQFKIIATLATAVSLIGLVFGVLMVFFLCWKAAFSSVSAGHILMYMLCIHAAVLVLVNFMRRRI